MKDGRFTINGHPEFLLGISYYAGLSASYASMAADLDQIRASGFNWIRVWATWKSFGHDVSAIDSGGFPRKEYLDRLERLVHECDRRGIIVDITLTRGGSGPITTFIAHQRAVETITRWLSKYANWYMDLANERNVTDNRFVSFGELANLRQIVKRIDPKRFVTASHGGDVSRDDLRDYLTVAQIDFVCPHRPREADSLLQTAQITRDLKRWMKGEGRIVPIHYQEPFRRGYGRWNPTADDYLDDLRGARESGAAGWCFHNGSQRDAKDGRPRRSFDLSEKRLFDQLDPVERDTVDQLRRRQSSDRAPRIMSVGSTSFSLRAN